MARRSMPRKMAETIQTSLEVGGNQVPVNIYFENRANVRYSVTGSAAHLRFPYKMSKEEQKKQWMRFQDWLKDTLLKNDKLQNHLLGRNYEDGTSLKVGTHSYLVRIKKTNKANHAAKLKGNTIFLELTNQDEGHHLQKAKRHLVSRCVAKHRLPEIRKRVDFFNDKYYNKTIEKVSFKLNQTNWGSCSCKNNLNFSTRLLFAPDPVIDYVIVHELAHLIEMNHSPSFWAIVKGIMPDYELKEEWLRTNSHLCNF